MVLNLVVSFFNTTLHGLSSNAYGVKYYVLCFLSTIFFLVSPLFMVLNLCFISSISFLNTIFLGCLPSFVVLNSMVFVFLAPYCFGFVRIFMVLNLIFPCRCRFYIVSCYLISISFEFMWILSCGNECLLLIYNFY